MGKGEMNKNEGNKRISNIQKQQPKRVRNDKDDDVPSSSNTSIKRQVSTRGSENKRPFTVGASTQGPQQVC